MNLIQLNAQHRLRISRKHAGQEKVFLFGRIMLLLGGHFVVVDFQSNRSGGHPVHGVFLQQSAHWRLEKEKEQVGQNEDGGQWEENLFGKIDKVEPEHLGRYAEHEQEIYELTNY